MTDAPLTMEVMRNSWKKLNEYANAPNPVFNILENPLLLIDGEPYEVQRTWKERLFTTPWRPFKRTKTIIPKVPDKFVYFIEGGKVCIAHPASARIIREKLEAIKK